MGSTLTVGIAGGRGLSTLMGFKAIEGVEVAALCDLDEELLAAKSKEHDIPHTYRVFDDMLESDIDAVVIPALNAQTFDISNAIADGDYARALQKTQELLAMQESCIGILGAIGAQIRRLYYAKTVAACGKGQQTLMELTKLQSYAANRTMAAANKLSAEFCRRAVELCLKADEQMKSSYDEPERILELLIVQLSAEARRD